MNSTDHHFHPLYTTICDIFKDVPLPQNRLQLFKDIETLEQITSDKEDKRSVENESRVSSEPIKHTVSTNVYMYRSSRKERAFIPPSITESSTNEPIAKQEKQDNFISLANYDSDEFDTSIKKHSRYINIHEDQYPTKQKKFPGGTNKSANVKYLPLKVKRLQGNVNRAKAAKVSKYKK